MPLPIINTVIGVPSFHSMRSCRSVNQKSLLSSVESSEGAFDCIEALVPVIEFACNVERELASGKLSVENAEYLIDENFSSCYHEHPFSTLLVHEIGCDSYAVAINALGDGKLNYFKQGSQPSREWPGFVEFIVDTLNKLIDSNERDAISEFVSRTNINFRHWGYGFQINFDGSIFSYGEMKFYRRLHRSALSFAIHLEEIIGDTEYVMDELRHWNDDTYRNGWLLELEMFSATEGNPAIRVKDRKIVLKKKEEESHVEMLGKSIGVQVLDDKRTYNSLVRKGVIGSDDIARATVGFADSMRNLSVSAEELKSSMRRVPVDFHKPIILDAGDYELENLNDSDLSVIKVNRSLTEEEAERLKEYISSQTNGDVAIIEEPTREEDSIDERIESIVRKALESATSQAGRTEVVVNVNQPEPSGQDNVSIGLRIFFGFITLIGWLMSILGG